MAVEELELEVYYVLRNINMTDLEIGCLLNDTGRQKLDSADYQMALVQGLEEILVYLEEGIKSQNY